MADINEIINALKFRQELKKGGAIPSEEIRIGKRNPNDGTYEARRANGNIERGIRTSNGGTTTNQIVRGIQADNNLWGLDWRNVAQTQTVQPSASRSNIAILYSQIETIEGQQKRVFYVGGLKKKPEKLPQKLNVSGSRFFNAYIWHSNKDFYVDVLSMKSPFEKDNEPLLTEYSSKGKKVKESAQTFLDALGWCGYGQWQSHCIIPSFDIAPGQPIVLNVHNYITANATYSTNFSTANFNGAFAVQSVWKDRKKIIRKTGELRITNTTVSETFSCIGSYSLNLESYVNEEKEENNYPISNSSSMDVIADGIDSTGSRTGSTIEHRVLLSNNQGSFIIAKITTTYISAMRYKVEINLILKTSNKSTLFNAYKWEWNKGVVTYEYKLESLCPKCKELTDLFQYWVNNFYNYATGSTLLFYGKGLNFVNQSLFTTNVPNINLQFQKNINWIKDTIYIISNEKKVLSEINKPTKSVVLEILSFKVSQSGTAIFKKGGKIKQPCFQVPQTTANPITVHSISYWKS